MRRPPGMRCVLVYGAFAGVRCRFVCTFRVCLRGVRSASRESSAVRSCRCVCLCPCCVLLPFTCAVLRDICDICVPRCPVMAVSRLPSSNMIYFASRVNVAFLISIIHSADGTPHTPRTGTLLGTTRSLALALSWTLWARIANDNGGGARPHARHARHAHMRPVANAQCRMPLSSPGPCPLTTLVPRPQGVPASKTGRAPQAYTRASLVRGRGSSEEEALTSWSRRAGPCGPT